jgi:hypothetical protein
MVRLKTHLLNSFFKQIAFSAVVGDCTIERCPMKNQGTTDVIPAAM